MARFKHSLVQETIYWGKAPGLVRIKAMSAVQAKLACWQIRINEAYDNTALDDKEKADMSAQSFGSK